MAALDTSKSQRRAMDLLGIQYNINISYQTAAYWLEQAGVSGDGLPSGHTWRSAAKLSDTDLVAKLRETYQAQFGTGETLRAAYGE